MVKHMETMRTNQRRPWLAGLLNLISPGLGQLYALRPLRAIAAFAASLIALEVIVLPAWVGAGRAVFVVGMAFAIAIFVAIITDAVLLAKRVSPAAVRPWYDRWYVYVALWLLVAIGLRAPLRTLIRDRWIEAFRVPSAAMMSTIEPGDFFYVVKGRSAPGALQRGDVIAYRSVTEPRLKVLGRILGIPGDTVTMRDGQLARNGELVREPYMQLAEPQRVDDAASLARMRAWQLAAFAGTSSEPYTPDRRTWGPLAIPDGAFFVLGDNRDNAYDSRYWGFVPADHVYGRIGTIYFSYDPASPRSLPFLTAVRWGRIGSTPQ